MTSRQSNRGKQTQTEIEQTHSYEMKHGYSSLHNFLKALDIVPLKKLLRKVKSYRIKGFILKWLTQVLACRIMQIVMEGQKNLPIKKADLGVPQ